MPPNPQAARFARAYKEMKKLGYQSKVVKPILQELLGLYNKDWSLIEEDNYQVLADAILNSEEQKVSPPLFSLIVLFWNNQKMDFVFISILYSL